jgi:hypothetical protein
MTHSYRAARGGSRAYRHYVCQGRNAGTDDGCPTPWLPAEEIERLVLDQIAAIGADEALAAEVLAEMASQAATEAKDAATRLEAAEAEVAACDRALRKAVTGRATIDPAELADLNERLRQAETAVGEARALRDAATQRLPDTTAGRAALRSFTPVLRALSPAEQTDLMQALLTTVTIDAARGSLVLAFRPTGIAALLERADPKEIAP